MLTPPDTERILRAYLAHVPALVSLVGERIGTTSTSQVVYPYLLFQRLGGPTTNAPDMLDAATIQFDAWAATKGDASAVIRTVHASLRNCGGWRTALGGITGAQITSGPQWLPDTLREPPTPRYTLSAIVYARTY